MRQNQKPNWINDLWYIPAVPTGKSEFGAPNCPVRALGTIKDTSQSTLS